MRNNTLNSKEKSKTHLQVWLGESIQETSDRLKRQYPDLKNHLSHIDRELRRVEKQICVSSKNPVALRNLFQYEANLTSEIQKIDCKMIIEKFAERLNTEK